MEKERIKVTVERSVSGLTLLLLAFWGDPDLWDALIHFLMSF